mmetsp:Transcript_6672/g.16730  ORF Transcript_6672/g.16730 Transcript_6672/m.16730 type:complete len:80 (-) Transcript_6672:1768-2007(-)
MRLFPVLSAQCSMTGTRIHAYVTQHTAYSPAVLDAHVRIPCQVLPQAVKHAGTSEIHSQCELISVAAFVIVCTLHYFFR